MGGAPAAVVDSGQAGRGQSCVPGFEFGCSCSEGNPPTLPASLEEDCRTSAWIFQVVGCMMGRESCNVPVGLGWGVKQQQKKKESWRTGCGEMHVCGGIVPTLEEVAAVEVASSSCFAWQCLLVLRP